MALSGEAAVTGMDMGLTSSIVGVHRIVTD
jgi:hypothetical protein